MSIVVETGCKNIIGDGVDFESCIEGKGYDFYNREPANPLNENFSV